MCVPVDCWKLGCDFVVLAIFIFLTLFSPKFNFALIPLNLTYPPCLKFTLINIKVASMIAVIFVP